MITRFRLLVVLALGLALVLATPVFAGGWAVITLDELPTGVVAGEPLSIGFTVRQHGKTPLPGLDPTITAWIDKSESFVVHAEESGEPGHYTATLTFPTEGVWAWSIQAFIDQPMPALNVAAGAAAPPAGQTAAKTAPVTSPLPLLWTVRILVLGLGLFGLVVALKRKSRAALALTAFALVAGLASFVIGPPVPEVEAQSKLPVKAVGDPSLSQVELGQQLFVAKGCITCHVNRKVPNSSGYFTVGMGAPDLTTFSASAEVLRIRLKDPAQANSATQMPNLGLDEAEIEALIAFINSK
ncbi:MAG: c-type cytochrome [Chloroflexota bacterium]